MGFEILASEYFEVGKHVNNTLMDGVIQLQKKWKGHKSNWPQATYIVDTQVVKVVDVTELDDHSCWDADSWGNMRFAPEDPFVDGLERHISEMGHILCAVKFHDGKSALIKMKKSKYRELSKAGGSDESTEKNSTCDLHSSEFANGDARKQLLATCTNAP